MASTSKPKRSRKHKAPPMPPGSQAEDPCNVFVNYLLQRVRCGKSSCRCQGDDQRFWHGPYWYAYWNDPETKRKRSRYMGKDFIPPLGIQHPAPFSECRRPPEPGEGAPACLPRRRRRTNEEAHQEYIDLLGQLIDASDIDPDKPMSPDDLDSLILGLRNAPNRVTIRRAGRDKLAELSSVYPTEARREEHELIRVLASAYRRMMRRRGWRC